ncbi:MAG: hypothetical protein PPP56_05025 [Longimonas sp.]|uniref:hypothetical protein n=1 Tax=Longimonas sp. TaxID=2039626 RepID=UPI003353E0B0
MTSLNWSGDNKKATAMSMQSPPTEFSSMPEDTNPKEQLQLTVVDKVVLGLALLRIDKDGTEDVWGIRWAKLGLGGMLILYLRLLDLYLVGWDIPFKTGFVMTLMQGALLLPLIYLFTHSSKDLQQALLSQSERRTCKIWAGVFFGTGFLWFVIPLLLMIFGVIPLH